MVEEEKVKIKIRDSFIFDGKEYGPFYIIQGHVISSHWPYTFEPVFKEYMSPYMHLFDAYVNGSSSLKMRGRVGKYFLGYCDRFDLSAFREIVPFDDPNIKFKEVGQNVRMAALILSEFSKVSKRILVDFVGCDPKGRSSILEFMRTNIGQRAILELDRHSCRLDMDIQ